MGAADAGAAADAPAPDAAIPMAKAAMPAATAPPITPAMTAIEEMPADDPLVVKRRSLGWSVPSPCPDVVEPPFEDDLSVLPGVSVLVFPVPAPPDVVASAFREEVVPTLLLVVSPLLEVVAWFEVDPWFEVPT